MPLNWQRYIKSEPSNGIGFLMRHPKTGHNISGLTRGTSNDIKLENPKDAEKQGRELLDKGVTSLRASDILRSKQAAEIISRVIGIRPVYTRGLEPIDLGKLTGVSSDEAKPQITHLIVDEPNKPFPGGQSYNQWRTQVHPEVLLFLTQIRNGKRPAIMTHGTLANYMDAIVSGGGLLAPNKDVLRNDPRQEPGTIWTVAFDGQRFHYEPLDQKRVPVQGQAA